MTERADISDALEKEPAKQEAVSRDTAFAAPEDPHAKLPADEARSPEEGAKGQEQENETGAVLSGESENEEKSRIAEVMKLLEEKQREIDALNDRFLRLQADFENFRRRSRNEKEELAALITEGLVRQMLPVIDNFERAMANAGTQDAAGLLAGVEMIHRQFSTFLEKVGVTPISAVGTQFNPELHEAVMRVEVSEAGGKSEGLILEELQKGYMFKGKAIRPSMVKVVGNS